MTVSFGKVGILCGGQSSEREISLLSGQNIYNALKSRGLDVYLFDTGENTVPDLVKEKFDVVFIALHGKYGEDGSIQGVLELLNIPYTGSGHMASSIAMNKVITKKLWMQGGLPTPMFFKLDKNNNSKCDLDILGFPLIIKPVHGGSTLGIKVANSYDDIDEAYKKAVLFDNEVFAEKYIVGRELTVSIIENNNDIEVLPIIEIITPNHSYDYEHKYFSEETKYLCPANLSKEITNDIIKISKDAYKIIECRGWARIDILLDEYDKPWLLEINTSPGMTSHSLVPISAREIGVDYSDLCLKILSGASCKI
ncbi:D-alanine-D-alanine ligase [Candidatus Kinetoplastibacterium desouzaii TCC079E]|uniref:D-alanine--D-alanine ligase n=1 Tax=Candidatus Kinetoplastidibacterium desouzai TCC079E TaxID=1208919 RepID=M1LV10_9PROT|nr:D-alanine--D-alanine ligase [Candidatus Kinetoplastibacterium desouzaii]AGF47119.1 D-alanine-D-alanine ligase [Candidatus Kinetoplastibacterium desouzaii TCC079E]